MEAPAKHFQNQGGDQVAASEDNHAAATANLYERRRIVSDSLHRDIQAASKFQNHYFLVVRVLAEL